MPRSGRGGGLLGRRPRGTPPLAVAREFGWESTLEQCLELLGRQVGIAEDAAEGADAEGFVVRHDDANGGAGGVVAT